MAKQGTQLATEYAQYYQIDPQQEGENDADFRGRVAGVLRDSGKIIEAHEAFNNERYEDSQDVMTGIFGAVAQTMQGANYGSKGEQQVDDDFAAGVVAQKPKEDPTAALLALLLFGGDNR